MKRPSILMLITFLFGIFIVLALHIAAPKKENHKHVGFERVFAPKGFIQPIDTLDLGRHGYYFAGVDSNRVFLANRKTVGYVLEVNTENLKDTTYHYIKADSLRYKALEVKVSPPYFFLMDGVMPFIYRGNTSDWVATAYIDSTYYVNALPISDSTFTLTKINNFKTSFHKITKGKKEPEIFPDLLEEQGGEGVFSTYGTIHYDKTNDQLVYVYLYRNEFFTMDSNFNLLSRGNTIDTITQVKIVVDKIASENSLTMSSPPLTVNPTNSVHNGYLYNNSNLLAGNEDPDRFGKASVIDVYNITGDKYQHSFYLPSHESKKIKAFKVVDNQILLALYDHDLVTYQISHSEGVHGIKISELSIYGKHNLINPVEKNLRYGNNYKQ